MERTEFFEGVGLVEKALNKVEFSVDLYSDDAGRPDEALDEAQQELFDLVSEKIAEIRKAIDAYKQGK